MDGAEDECSRSQRVNNMIGFRFLSIGNRLPPRRETPQAPLGRTTPRELVWCPPLLAVVMIPFVLPPPATGQNATAVSAAPWRYITPASLPGDARPCLSVYGKRLQVSGMERTTLSGTYTTSTSVPVTITYQIPNSMRIDLGGSAPRSIIFNGKTTTATAGSADETLVESLSDDSAESYFLGFSSGAPAQWLGSRFRTDDGKAANYTGPLYDIYRRIAPAVSVTGNPIRQKLYVFDSRTKLFNHTRYKIVRSGQPVTVMVTYPTWTKSGTESFPASIIRTENGQQVFSISVAAASTAAGSTADAVFTIH